MAKIKIISDSSCDLPEEIVAQYDIVVIPFLINLGDKILKDDGVEVTSQIIYDYVDKTGVLPGTIGVPVEAYRAEFEKWHEQGYDIICHTISSDFSSSYMNAKVAAEGMDGVWVLDTRNLSSGVGMLVLNSATLARQGMEASEVLKATKALVSKVSVTFILDTLDYMKKGGRCSMVIALGANLFKIKPMIAVENGLMKVAHKFRGPLKSVLENYIDLMLEGHDDIKMERIVIAHTGCSNELIDLVKDKVRKHKKFGEVIVAPARATVTSHSGPNTLGIIFLKK